MPKKVPSPKRKKIASTPIDVEAIRQNKTERHLQEKDVPPNIPQGKNPQKKNKRSRRSRKRTNLHGELPRIFVPEPWTREDVLQRYVYVLLPQYFFSNATDDIMFYAYVDGVDVKVRRDTVQQFFADHVDRTFITYDALAFHRVCMDAFADSRKDQVAVWRLSRDYRLWDVAFLARRIEYAEKGYAAKIGGADGWPMLLKKYAAEQTATWDRLQAVFVSLVRYAVSELPIFRTYWNWHRFDDGKLEIQYSLPLPLTIDEYYGLNCMTISRGPLEENAPEPPRYYHNLTIASLFRRRDQVLTEQTGPLGIGLDLQSTIVSDSLNNKKSEEGLRFDSEAVEPLESLFLSTSDRLKNSELAPGFKWDNRKICRDKKGYVEHNSNVLREILKEKSVNRSSFVTGEITTPLDSMGQLSTRFADWIEFSRFDRSIEDWIRLESCASLLQQKKRLRPPSCMDFPSPRTPVAEVFLTNPEAFPFLPPHKSTLVAIEMPYLPAVTFICVAFLEYLFYRTSIQGKDTTSHENYFDMVADCIQQYLSLTSPSFDPKAISTSDFASLSEKYRQFPVDAKKRIICSIIDSYITLEHADALRERLNSQGLELNLPQLDLLVCLALRSLVAPFMSEGFQFRFFQVPRATVAEKEKKETLDRLYSQNERTLDYDEMLIWTINAQLGTKSFNAACDVHYWENIRKDKKHGWGFIDKLIANDYWDFFHGTSGRGYRDLQFACEHMAENRIRQSFATTNRVSCRGRLGPPIRYYEWLRHDCQQLAEDIRTSVAFAMIERGINLLWITSNGFVVQVPEDREKVSVDAISHISHVVIKEIKKVLLYAFPSHDSLERRIDELIKGQLKNKIF